MFINLNGNRININNISTYQKITNHMNFGDGPPGVEIMMCTGQRLAVHNITVEQLDKRLTEMYITVKGVEVKSNELLREMGK